MGDKISDYVPDQASNPIKVADVLDISNENGGGGFDVSKKITVGEMLTFLNANLNTYYNADGNPEGDRTVDMRFSSISYDATFLGGDVVCEMDNGTDDFGFLVKNDSGVVRGAFVYDQAAEGGKITLNTPFGEFFNATDDIINMGNGALTVNKLTGVVDSEDGYWISTVKMLHTGGVNPVASNVYSGDQAGSASTSSATNNVGIGSIALLQNIVGDDNVAVGFFALRQNKASRNVGVGSSAAAQLTTGVSIVAIGDQALGNLSTDSHATAVGFIAGNGVINGSGCTFVGSQAGSTLVGQVATVRYSMAFGRSAVTLQNNQLVFGSDDSNAFLTEGYFGAGVEDSVGFAHRFDFRTTNVEAGQTDQANTGHLVMTPGVGTSEGVGAFFKVDTAPTSGSTGSVQNTPVTALQVDASKTAGDTRFLIYDVDNGTLERVTVGAADSGGTNFKVLRIPN